MAGIVQSDALKLLFRKIGYSVGLEFLFRRTDDLVRLYADDGDVSFGAWTNLVEKQWGRQLEHMGDVFYALNILQTRQRQTYVLWGLDALASIYKLLGDGRAYTQARNIALTSLIVYADSDIFLNCIASGDDNTRLKVLLTDLIAHKRRVLFGLYKLDELRRQIARVITIENQPTNRGGALVGKGLDAGRRTTPLSAEKHVYLPPEQTPITITADYFRKAPPRRREWAVSAGLLGEGNCITDLGSALLREFGGLGLKTEGGAYYSWPLAHELMGLNIPLNSLGVPVLNFWQFFSLTGRPFGYREVPLPDGPTSEEVVSILADIQRTYQHLNPSRAPLRREVPIPVACLAYIAISAASGTPRPSLMAFIDKVKRQSVRPVDFRSSKFNEGAVMIRKRG